MTFGLQLPPPGAFFSLFFWGGGGGRKEIRFFWIHRKLIKKTYRYLEQPVDTDIYRNAHNLGHHLVPCDVYY